MSAVLERTRALCEEVEIGEAVLEELLQQYQQQPQQGGLEAGGKRGRKRRQLKKHQHQQAAGGRTRKQELALAHGMAHTAQEVARRAEEVVRHCADKEGALREEVQRMRGGRGGRLEAMMSHFYSDLKVDEQVGAALAAAAAGTTAVPTSSAVTAEAASNSVQAGVASALARELPPFSGEEVFGKYVDMHALHEQFCNLPFFLRLNTSRLPAAEDGSDGGEGEVGTQTSAASGVRRRAILRWRRCTEYTTFLEQADNLGEIPEEWKVEGGASGRAQYQEYLHALWDYLWDFFQRTQPLADMDETLKFMEEDFERDWATGRVRGWAPAPPRPSAMGASVTSSGSGGSGRGAAQSATNGNDDGDDGDDDDELAHLHTTEDLQALGLDKLKHMLQSRGLKCGGTLEQRAERLLSVKGKSEDEIDPKLFARRGKRPRPGASTGAKAKPKAKAIGTAAVATAAAVAATGGSVPSVAACAAHSAFPPQERKEIARLESRIRILCEQYLSDVMQATMRHVEKQQTRTVEEKLAELEEEELGVLAALHSRVGGDGGDGSDGDTDSSSDSDGDEDGPGSNPLNLPLGWDGKPIPFWLYKLHGMGVEFKCEICNNRSYWGRRAYDRHFQEATHANRMKLLGIPNTRHFHDITSIAEAKALYAHIKDEVDSHSWQADEMEEFEDTHGNVLDKQTYLDRARSGWL